MTQIETTNKNFKQQLSAIEKRNRELPKSISRGTIVVEGKYGTIKFERRLNHPKETIWKAITDQKEIFRWLPDYKGTFDQYKGGSIDLLNVVSGSHVTGSILVYDLYRAFEYEWHIAPNQMFPKGEPESVIQWELRPDGESDSLLIVTHKHLTKSTALTFAPGWHTYLDRLEAVLNNQEPPNWAHRFAEVKELYST
ncbi:MAG TPA: SRPBCC domain-containing protein [Candidatus Saccharimonadales bacterium]|nr:SRPBCC domain-containing protein [Candidatus Saccharimonadales bacterium]